MSQYKFNLHPLHRQEVVEDGIDIIEFIGIHMTNKRGERWNYITTFEKHQAEEAGDTLHMMQEHVNENPTYTPNWDYWVQGPSIYGSEAYQQDGGEQELARFCIETLEGPGAYNPTHPEYIG